MALDLPTAKVRRHVVVIEPPQCWKRVTRFNQLKAGDTVRFIARPRIEGTYRWEGHGLAVVHVARGLTGAPRDVLARLKEIEVLFNPTRKAKEATNV